MELHLDRQGNYASFAVRGQLEQKPGARRWSGRVRRTENEFSSQLVFEGISALAYEAGATLCHLDVAKSPSSEKQRPGN
jgi:hypothetical protein